jgi:hypothetical protein
MMRLQAVAAMDLRLQLARPRGRRSRDVTRVIFELREDVDSRRSGRMPACGDIHAWKALCRVRTLTDGAFI